MKDKRVLVCIKRPGEKAYVDLLENTLEAFQKEVGGGIECFNIASDLTIVCNEEGRIWDLPYNTTICGMPFYGPVIAVGVSGEDFVSVKGALVSFVLRMLSGDDGLGGVKT